MFLMALALMAAEIDYSALVTEMQEARADAEVQSYLATHLVEARELERLNDRVQLAAANAQTYRQQAAESRRQRNIAIVALASGDSALQKMGTEIMRSGMDPLELEQRAANEEEAAKDGLVRAALRYRELRAAIAAEKRRPAPARAKR